nr:hypothetical protein [Tolivirales sp.]
MVLGVRRRFRSHEARDIVAEPLVGHSEVQSDDSVGERGWINWGTTYVCDTYLDGDRSPELAASGSRAVIVEAGPIGRSRQHYVAAFRMVAWLAGRAERRRVALEVSAAHRAKQLRWARLAGRIVRTQYWRSAGAAPVRTKAVELERGWRMSDLIPNCVRRFGVAAAQRVLAGRVTAAFLALSPDEEGASSSRFHASAWDSFATWASGRHKQRHRASNRWVGRMALLRKLRERLIFGAEGIRRVRSPVNDAWCSIQARKLVSECVDAGEIDGRHARWYRDALVTVFYLEDDDDVFFSAVASTPGERVY